MARRKLDKGTRVIVTTAGVVVGLALGIVAVIVIRSGGGDAEARPYQPFFVGTADRVTRQIKDGGPVCYPDPRRGERSFCLDLDVDRIVALHVIPPGGAADCLVQWDRDDKRYEDCRGRPADRNGLARF